MRSSALLCSFLILSCSGADDSGALFPDALVGGDAASLAIAWEARPLRSDGVGEGAECAEVTVESVAPFLVDLDFYLIDHRGTGRSSRLGCAAEADLVLEPAEWPACAAELAATWGERLDGFRTTEAARDLGELIERTRAPGQEVHIHGGSYGTYLAQRYLQLYPTQPTAVSLLGIAPPTISFADYDAWFDRVGGDYLAACGGDAFCASKLGPDPAARVRTLFASLDAGHCRVPSPRGSTAARCAGSSPR